MDINEQEKPEALKSLYRSSDSCRQWAKYL